MNKKHLLLALASSLLLTACGPNEEPAENSGVSSSGDGGSSPAIIESGDASCGFSLVMFGDLYLNQMRSIYARLEDGKSGNVVFESSDPTVISCSNDENRANQALLFAKKEGEATISAHIEGEEGKTLSKKFVISHGTALSEETYAKLTGSLKVELTEKLYDYDEKLNATLNKAYSATTVYEENEDYPNVAYHNTDAYQTKIVERATGKTDYEATFVRNGTRLAAEYINANNEIGKRTLYTEDGDERRWVNSIYENPFKFDSESDGEGSVPLASDFETFDGGNTYHYVGSSLTATRNIAASFLVKSIYPDDFVIKPTADGIDFAISTDPASSLDDDALGGTLIEGKASEFGTAKIDHLEPYAHETYHDALEKARKELAEGKNYTTTYTTTDDDYGKTVYTYVFTADTVDQKMVASDGTITHNGAHKTDSGYFTYTYDDASKKLTKVKDYSTPFESENVTRYPTFDFAVEIFSDEGNGVYKNRGDSTSTFLYYCWYLPSWANKYTPSSGAKLTVKDGHFSSIEASFSMSSDSYEDDIAFSAVFSDIGTSKLDYDWAAIQESDEPTEFPSTLLNSMKQWGIDEVVPYLNPKNAGFGTYADLSGPYWKDSSGTMDQNYKKYLTFDTAKFDTSDLRDAYIADYKALLEKEGWTLSEEEDANLGYLYYVNPSKEWKLSVGPHKNYSGGSADNAVTFTITNADNKLAIPEGLSEDD